jgi:hypothetical protein
MRKLNLRARYEGGGYTVTAKHWWSPKERKSARLAARLMEHQAPEIKTRMDAELRERMRRFYLYGKQP